MSPNTVVQHQSPEASVKPPSVIARRYRVDGLLAEGGMARVYRGWHLPFDQPIAIKILKDEYSSNKEAVTRFLGEARAGALLRGKHVAQVLDIGRMEGGPPFMISELLSGRDLQQLLFDRGPLPVEEAVRLLGRVCAALGEVHASGIVHRDLKPANIFLTADKRGRPLIKLLDFGIAKRLDARTLNDTKASLGSPHYMAPEQIVSPEAVDRRADIWSLGIVLFELLTGEVPFDAATVPSVCGQVLKSEPKAPSALRHEIPEALDSIVLRCLAKDPAERFQEVRDLRRALGSLLRGAESAPTELSTKANELDVPVFVSLTQLEPAPRRANAATGSDEPRVSWRRHTVRVAAGLTLAAASTFFLVGWAPARDLVERASHSVAQQTHEGYARASGSLPEPLRLWVKHLNAEAPPAPRVGDAPTRIEVQPVDDEPEVTRSPDPPPAPRKPVGARPGPTKAPPAGSKARAAPIEHRYPSTPARAPEKLARDELLDPYPDLH